MLNYLWIALLVLGITFSFLTGKGEVISKTILESSNNAVNLCFGLLGVICFWNGLIKILEKSNVVILLTTITKPLMRILFPEIPPNHPAIISIVMNLVSNFLGLGNAATPSGIKAMHELQKLNKNKETASNSMSMFLVLNTTAIQLIPTTIIATRIAASSLNATQIICPIWFVSFCSTLAGILIVKIFSYLFKIKDKKI